MKGAVAMKKIICIIIVIFAALLLYGCEKANITESPSSTESPSQTKPSASDSATELCSVPLMPTDNESAMLRTAYRKMSKSFEGAIVKNHKVLQLGEVGGKHCKRFLFETDKGEFVAVMTEQCEILFEWKEGDEKTAEYYFPQAWDTTVASDENLMIAFNSFHEDEHYANEIILDYRQEMADFTDGSTAQKVLFVTESGDYAVLISEDGRIVSKTK